VSHVKYELDFYIPEDTFFIVTAVKTSNVLPYIRFIVFIRHDFWYSSSATEKAVHEDILK
jgi:hypothetical protein